MSSRALKKLVGSNTSEEPVEVEDAEEWTPAPKQSIFSMVDIPELMEGDAPDSDSDSAQEKVTQQPFQTPKRKKRTKRNKRKATKSKLASSPEITDDDILLEAARQSCSNRELSTTKVPVAASTRPADLLAVNRKFLDYRAELQRKFGSSLAAGARAHYSLPFGQLVRPKATWPPLAKCGLEMKTSSDTDGSCMFAFAHSKDYSKQQKAFYALQDMMDPNTLSMVLSKAPYHVDTLLHLSDYLMHQDQSEVAVDMIERALYACQSAFHLTFNFATASCRMDYRVQENRSFFVAIFRYLFYVASRSCYRSALEYSKVLLLLDPENDPLAIILAIDFLAISTEEYEFLISFYDTWNPKRNLNLLPNFAFSMPLVRWLQRNRLRKRKQSEDLLDSDEIDKMLQDALIMFPGFLTRLMHQVKVGGTDNLDKSVLFGKEIRLSESESLSRLLDLYVSQSRYHWQEPDVLPWLEANVVVVLGLVEPIVVDADDASTHGRNVQPDERLVVYSERRKRLYPQPPRNILRYIFLRDLPDVPPLVPPAFASQQIYPLDPFPPADSINTYDPEAERRQRGDTEGGIMGFLNTLFSTLWPTVPSREEEVADLNAILAQFGLAVVVEEVDIDAEAAETENEVPPHEFD
ncbi:Transcription factor 25 [Echinococcus granulosus]|uniref:Transcription factor 25 n=1 Tax=Echinococcus granulosus TaxID=6210 RepID=W6U851_ECHGR|nr:Transcription factor 25 [Echinococcus granulosus]EUB57340.1 Transcription factor 25 [Echinococcus granulosus]